jgi:Zn-dependent protease
MLFGLLNVLLDSPEVFWELLPLVFATIVLALLVGITVHEFAHAYTAHLLGDDTARRLGRVSLNPIKHLDPLGTFFLLIVGIGWGKPVPVNASLLQHGARRGMAMVAFAGPLSNFILAGLVALPIKLGAFDWDLRLNFFRLYLTDTGELLPVIMSSIVFFNLLLGIFNLIPLAPLDGSKVLMGLLPSRQAYSLAKVEPYGPMILIFVFLLDSFNGGPGILGTVLRPVMDFFLDLFVGQTVF